jgi:hypothetical protein
MNAWCVHRCGLPVKAASPELEPEARATPPHVLSRAMIGDMGEREVTPIRSDIEGGEAIIEGKTRSGGFARGVARTE